MPKWVDFRAWNSMTAMNRRVVAFDFGLLLVVAFSVIPGANAQATYTLKATPKTVAWGYYDAKAAPVLHVRSWTGWGVPLSSSVGSWSGEDDPH